MLTFQPKVNDLSAIDFSKQNSEEKYRQLFEQALEAIVIADSESGIILECNQAAAELVERTKDGLIGQHESILYPPEEAKNGFTKPFKNHQQLTMKKDGIQLYTKIITKDGKITDVSIKANLIDVGGKKIIYGSFRDITQQKQAEAALRYSEEQFRILAEDWPNMIFIIQDGKAVYVNQECVRVTGYSKEEIFAPDFNFSKLISPEFLDIMAEKYDKNLKGLDLNPFEFRLLTKNGTSIDAIWSARPITFNGKLGLIGLATDITERKKNENQIITQSKQMEAIFTSSPDAITVADLSGKILDCNQASVALIGYNSKDAVLGKNIFQLVSPKDHQKVFKVLAQVMETGIAAKNIEFTFLTKDGKEIPVESSGSVIKDSSGKLANIVAVTRDISERKKAEEQIRLLSTVVEQEVDGIAVSDDQGKILFLNKSWLAMHDLKDGGENLIGEPIIRFYDPEQLRVISAKTDTAGIFRGRLKQISKDGTSFTALATLSPLRDKEGQIIGTIHTAKKLTEIVREIRDVGSHVSIASTTGEEV